MVVIGVDGADWSLIRPWVEQGKLPHFARLLREGAAGELESPIPPSSAIAWTSAVTGTNPGKHGVFGFIKANRLGPDGRRATAFFTSRDRVTEPVWSVLGRAGKSVGLVNIPLSSPPDSVRGFMISGFPHLSESDYAYPEALKRELLDYRLDAYGREAQPGHEREFLDDVYDVERRRLAASARLMREREWDLFWVVFTVTDRVQHYFWRFMDPAHPLYRPDAPPELRDAVLHAYQFADSAIGALSGGLDEKTVLFVISDHGFGPTYRQVNGEAFARRLNERHDDAEIYATDNFGAKFGVRPAGAASDSGGWREARARLVEGLRTLEDPAAGRPVMASVWTKEELYSGPSLGRAPDVIGLETDGYLFLNWSGDGAGPLFAPPDEHFFSAFHRVQGILAARGPGIPAGREVTGARLLDIAPTILALLGAPLPDNLDGQPLAGLFGPGWGEAHDPGRQAAVLAPGAGEDFADRTQEELERQLRSVGYVQ